MLRRQTRERREYLYRKSLEATEREEYEKRHRIREALNAGKPIPTELRDDELALREKMQLEDPNSGVPDHDDEYANAGMFDPKIVVTTSRDPSSRLDQFTKEMRLVFPGAQKINRGNYVIKELADACRANGVTDLIIFHETRGEPDGMIVSHFPYGPTAYFSLHNVVQRHDIEDRGTVSEQFPHLIFDQFTTPLGLRVKSILRHLFPVPRPDSRRTMTFANRSDYISFRHHVFVRHGGGERGGNEVDLSEVGPRFELKLYKITQGTIDIGEADVEWVARPYMNTSHKRDFL